MDSARDGLLFDTDCCRGRDSGLADVAESAAYLASSCAECGRISDEPACSGRGCWYCGWALEPMHWHDYLKQEAAHVPDRVAVRVRDLGASLLESQKAVLKYIASMSGNPLFCAEDAIDESNRRSMKMVHDLHEEIFDE